MAEAITNERVVELAERWARLHATPKLRGRMDAVVEDLSESDARRVILCGQRIAGGLPAKVLPAEVERKPDNGKSSSKPKRKRTDTAK